MAAAGLLSCTATLEVWNHCSGSSVFLVLLQSCIQKLPLHQRVQGCLAQHTTRWRPSWSSLGHELSNLKGPASTSAWSARRCFQHCMDAQPPSVSLQRDVAAKPPPRSSGAAQCNKGSVVLPAVLIR